MLKDRSEIEDALAKLARDKDKSIEGTMYYVVGVAEAGKAPDAADLQRLAASKNPTAQDIVAAYGTGPLSRQGAEAILERIESDDSALHQAIAEQVRTKAGIKTPPATGPPSDLGKALVGLMILAVAGIGLILLVGYLALRSQGKLQPLGSPTGIPNRADGDRYATRAVQAFVFYIASSLILVPFAKTVSPALLSVLEGLIMLISAAILLLLPVGGKLFTLKKVGVTGENLGKNVVWGVAGALGNLPIVIVAFLVSIPLTRGLPPPEHPISQEIAGGGGIGMMLALFFVACIVAPLWEEFVFRGHILPAMTALFRSPAAGIFGSAFLFASIHPQGIAGWPMLFTLGAVLAALTYQTRSLVPSMVMHFTHNFLTLLAGLNVS